MMRVEVQSASSYTDDDQHNLKKLLEAFGSAVSLQDIASAYCESGRNLDLTAGMLCNMQGSSSGTSSSKSLDNLHNTTIESSGSSSNSVSELKSRKCSASMGIVSDVIGKDYIRPRSQVNGVNGYSKPIKLNSDDFPASAIWDEKTQSASSHQTDMDKDLKEFLYKMLRNVYQLDMDVIQDVMGQCGYNMPKTMDKLLDLSAAALEKSDDVVGIAAGNTTQKSFGVGSTSQKKRSPFSQRTGRADELKLPHTETKKKDIQREVLEALFSGPARVEEEYSPPIRSHRESPYGRIVTKPPEETPIEDFTFMTRQAVNVRKNETNEDNYDELRIAVVENWVTMKEYYKASVEAYMKGDYDIAQNLLEQGNFYMKKAREADEKSVKLITEDSDDDEEFSLNVHYFDPREALHHVKMHLTSLCAMPTVRYLKLVVGTDGADKKDARRKHLVTKLLEKEGISWTEEGNGWTISVRIDEIDPKQLSFSNK